MSDVSAEALREVADLLFGGGADELIAKMNPTQEEVKGMSPKQRTVAHRANMAGNTVATIGGAHAMALALGHKDLPGGPKMGRGVKRIGDAAKKTKTAGHLRSMGDSVKSTKTGTKWLKAAKNPKTAGRIAAASAAGWVGLHGVELAADVSARHALKQNYKRKMAETKKIGKSLNTAKDIPEAVGNIPTTKGQMTMAAAKTGAKHAKTGVAAGKAGMDAGKKGVKAGKGFLTKFNVNTVATKNNPVINKTAYDVTWEGEFSKVDKDKQQVFGWASIVEMNGEKVVDLQGDYISIDEIEKSAYEYVVKSRKGGNMHARDGANPMHTSDMIESFIVTPEKIEKMGLPESTPHGWWVGYQVNDPETWEMVKSGKRNSFSIHGRGMRTDA